MKTTTMEQVQQCAFCLHDVPGGQRVCLTCGAQKSAALPLGGVLLGYVAVIAWLVCAGFAVYCAPFGGGLLAALPMAIGAPEWVAVTAFLVGAVATFGVLSFLAWKLCMGGWLKLFNRDSVWVRGDAALPMRPPA